MTLEGKELKIKIHLLPNDLKKVEYCVSNRENKNVLILGKP